MKLRHGPISKGRNVVRKATVFVGAAVLSAGIMLSGCGERRAGLSNEPQSNQVKVSEETPCSESLKSSEGAMNLVSQVHTSMAVNQERLMQDLDSQEGETVDITWHFRVEGDGRAVLLDVGTICEGRPCGGQSARNILQSIPEARLDAPENGQCIWDISTVIESQRPQRS